MHPTVATGEEERLIGDWVRRHPLGSIWQSPGWAALQRRLGRTVRMFLARRDGAVIGSALTVETGRAGMTDWQVPRGPLFAPEATAEERAGFVYGLKEAAARAGALALYASPAAEMPELAAAGFRPSGRHEQPEASIVLDLTLPEEALLAQMKPKGRYNIRLAERHGVTVEQSRDIPAYARLAAQTAVRDGFTPPGERHYEAFLSSLEGSFLLLAFPPAAIPRSDPGPIAGLIGVVWGETAIYYYGASSSAHRELMAPYLLQWHAMGLARRLGAARYDLLGIAPPDAGSEHPWAGVTDFKRKFGGEAALYPPEREIVLRPLQRAALSLKRRLLG